MHPLRKLFDNGTLNYDIEQFPMSDIILDQV